MDQNDVKYGFMIMKRCILSTKVRRKYCFGATLQLARIPTKSSKVPSDTRHPSNYDSHLKTADEVNIIFKSLKDKHGGEYTPEQLRTWAHNYAPY
jgi:hypothetical protein